MTFDPMSVEVTCVTLPKDHCVQVPWQHINVCGYSDQFCKIHTHTTYILHTTYRMSDHIVSYWTQFKRDNYWTQFRRDKKTCSPDFWLIMQGKYKNGKLVKFMPGLWNKSIVLNIILCWFCSTMLQQTIKLNGNGKTADVIHFISFHGMLPVIFWIFSPSSHFVKPVINESCPSKWRAWRVLAKA